MSGTNSPAVEKLRPEDRVTRSADVIWRRVDDEVVILNADGTTLTTLNTTAAVAWEAMDGTLTIDRVAECVATRFDVAKERALPDVVELCEGLRDAALVSVSPTRSGGGPEDAPASS